MNPRIGKVDSFGWQRFPAADIPNGLCYQLPNGEYMFLPKEGSYCIVQYDGEPHPIIKPMRTKQEPKQ
jgi:hypothetical protein